MKRETVSMLMSGIIFVGLGFVAGYAVSGIFTEEVPPVAAVAVAEEIPTPTPMMPVAEATAEPDYYGVYYLIKAEEGELILYEADGEQRQILRKNKINVNNFPPSDAAELENGIREGTLEGALAMWENFIE